MNDTERLIERPGAPRWRRVVARVLDLMTVFTLLWILSVLRVLWFMGDLSTATAAGPWGRALAPTVAFVALAVIYETIFLRYNHGQTPGKDVVRVRVVGRDGELSASGAAARAAAANLVWMLPSPLLAAGAFVVAAIAFTLDRRLAWHDRFGTTRVVVYDRSAEDPDAPPPPSFVRPAVHEPAIDTEAVA